MYYGKLKYLNCGKITARGWIKEQLERSKSGMGGHLDELEPKMIIDPYIKKSTTAAWGAAAAGWGAEISGNYWYGLIGLAFTLPDKELQQKAENWVNAVIANQCEDGYLGAYGENDDLSEDFNAWGNACGMRALLLYAEATDRQDVFEAVHKGLLWFCRTDKWHFTAYAGAFILKLMSYCYIKTGDKELLNFCRRYEDWLSVTENDTFRHGIKAQSDNDLFYNQNHTAGYANMLSHSAAVFLSDGDNEKLSASLNGLKKLREHCLLPNGGYAGNAEWLSPKSAIAETEYCTATYINESYAILVAATGEARFGDYMEQNLFNVAQGSRKKDERAITYFSAPNQLCATDHSSHVHDPHGMYAPVHSTSCCSANSVVIIPEFVKNMAMTDNADNLYILAYGPCRIEHKNAVIELDTLYPFRKDISIKISTADNSPAEFSIFLKKPEWCEDMSITAEHGRTVSAADNGFHKLSGSFENGETISLHIEMQPRIIETDDTDGADKHPLSVLYGPLCFSLPVTEKWVNKGSGYAQTPLPEGWYWYDVEKDVEGIPQKSSATRMDNHIWNFATTKKALEGSLKVFEEEPNGYVWENPPISISAKGWHAPYLYNHYTPRTNEFYGKEADVTFEKTVKLIPYGCTALRITCFPKAKIN